MRWLERERSGVWGKEPTGMGASLRGVTSRLRPGGEVPREPRRAFQQRLSWCRGPEARCSLTSPAVCRELRGERGQTVGGVKTAVILRTVGHC